MATPTRIGGGRKPHLYILEHMEHAKASKAAIAGRLDVHRATIGKWLAKGSDISVDELTKLAYALDLDSWEAFLRPPGYESIDPLVQDAPDLHAAVVDFVKRVKGSAA